MFKLQNAARIKLILPFIFFSTITLIFLWKILFTSGIVVGQDWMFPLTTSQLERYIERPFFSWTYDMNLFGVKNPFFVQMPFIILVKLFLLCGFDGEILSKVVMFACFSLSGTSMFYLLKFLRLNNFISILGGYILITSPFFLNYAIMGWCFVLFSVGIILPIAMIFFIKSIEEDNKVYSVACGLLFSIAILQSQSLVWYPLVFLTLSFFLIKNKSTFFTYIISFSLIVLLGLSMHTSWWPNLIFARDSGVMKSDLILDPVSAGMRARLSNVNIFRGWGSLFNQFFEISYPKKLEFLSFIVPLLAFCSLFLKKFKLRDIRIPLIVILIFMFTLYNTDPKILAKIPFSNIIRDIARFTSLTSFAFSILACFFLNYLFESKKLISKIFVNILIVIIVLAPIPFYTGALTGEAKNEYDVRMRNYGFTKDYRDVEKYLYSIKRDAKSYYPPSGTNISLTNNFLFHGDCKNFKDPFRGYSPLPGTIYMHYSSMGRPGEVSSLLDSLFNYEINDQSLMLMGLMNIEYIVIRKDSDFPDLQLHNLKKLISNTENNYLLPFGNISIVKNKYFLPHIYVAKKIINTNKKLDEWLNYVSADEFEMRKAIFFSNETNSSRTTVLPESESTYSSIPKIKFTKINSTKYLIQVERAKHPFVLVFSESYHDLWNIFLNHEEGFLDTSILGKIFNFFKNSLSYFLKNKEQVEINNGSYFNGEIKEGNHKMTFLDLDIFDNLWEEPIAKSHHNIVNGYANSWYISPKDVGGKENFELTLEFLPQKGLFAGFLFSIMSLIGCFIYFGIKIKNLKRH